ncbi:MAG: hypothetical protein ACO289_10145 [Prochlorococcaceae cyanobacterium]
MDQDRALYPSPEARARFGRTLTAWCNRNGWIHSTLQDWGHEAGFPAVRDSTFNKLQNGKTEQPSPLTFIQLELANARVAEGDFSGVVDRRLKERLEDSEPMRLPNGQPWRAAEFFAHFVGQLDAPEWAHLPKPLGAEELASLSADHRTTFEAITKAKALTPPQAWKQLERHCKAMTPSQRDLLRNVLSGWHEWTAPEWSDLAGDSSDPVADALEAWQLG